MFLHAQSYFFEPAPDILLSKSEQLLQDSLISNSFVDAYFLMKMDLSENNISNEQIKILLPNLETELRFQIDAITSNNPNEFYISTFNTDGSTFNISKFENEVFGKLYSASDNNIYFLRNISDNKAVLLKINPNYSPQVDRCEEGDELENLEYNYSEERLGVCEEKTVKILFLYSPASLPVLLTTMPAFSSGIIGELNSANTASGITSAQLNFVSAGSFVLPGFVEHKCSGRTLDNLRNDPSAKLARELTYADIVCLIIDNVAAGYPPCDATGSAVNSAGAGDAYLFSQVNTALTNFKATHGVAHIFGALHQRCSNCSDIRCSLKNIYPHGWKISPFFKTIMTDCVDNGRRVSRWSAPAIPFAGLPTGDTRNDNARKMRERASEIACFRTEPPQNNLIINGPSTVCYGQTYSFTVGQGLAFANVRWERRYSNSPYWEQVGTGGTIWIQAWNPSSVSFQLRATLTGFSPGSKIVGVMNCFNKGNMANERFEEHIHQIYPNPANESIQIEGTQLGDKINLYDNKGQKVTSHITLDLSSTIFLGNLEKGVYHVEIAGKEKVFHYKIIKL